MQEYALSSSNNKSLEPVRLLSRLPCVLSSPSSSSSSPASSTSNRELPSSATLDNKYKQVAGYNDGRVGAYLKAVVSLSKLRLIETRWSSKRVRATEVPENIRLREPPTVSGPVCKRTPTAWKL